MGGRRPKVITNLSQSEQEAIGPLQKKADGTIRLQLHVKPGAKQSQVTDISETSIGVQVRINPFPP